MTGKYSSAGWKKYEFPPDMITQEQGEKTMKLTKHQLQKMLKERIFTKAKIAGQTGDKISEEQWKSFLIRTEARSIREKLNDEFIEDFIFWLQGRSPYNATEFDRILHDEDGNPIERETITGTPWGNTPLFSVPGVSEFLDQGLDRRQKVITYLSKLKLRTPRNIDECFIYFKYLVRGVGLDDKACHEVASFAQFDNPVGPSGEPGGPVGPSPPFFDESTYRTNFRLNFDVAKNDPATYIAWLMERAPPIPFFARGLADELGARSPEIAEQFAREAAAGNIILYGPEGYYPIDKSGNFLFTEEIAGESPENAYIMNYYELSPEDRDVMVATAYTFYAAGGYGVPEGAEGEAGADRPATGPADIAAIRKTMGATKRHSTVKDTKKKLKKVKSKAEKRTERMEKLRKTVGKLDDVLPKDATLLREAIDAEKRRISLRGPARGHTKEEATAEDLKDFAELEEIIRAPPRTSRKKRGARGGGGPRLVDAPVKVSRKEPVEDPEHPLAMHAPFIPYPGKHGWDEAGNPLDKEGTPMLYRVGNYYFKTSGALNAKKAQLGKDFPAEEVVRTYNPDKDTVGLAGDSKKEKEMIAKAKELKARGYTNWEVNKIMDEGEEKFLAKRKEYDDLVEARKKKREAVIDLVKETGGPAKEAVIDLIEAVEAAPPESLKVVTEIIKEAGKGGIVELAKGVPVEARKTNYIDFLEDRMNIPYNTLRNLKNCIVSTTNEETGETIMDINTDYSDRLLSVYVRALQTGIRSKDTMKNLFIEAGMTFTSAGLNAKHLFEFKNSALKQDIDTARAALDFVFKVRENNKAAISHVLTHEKLASIPGAQGRFLSLMRHYAPEEVHMKQALHGEVGKTFGYSADLLSEPGTPAFQRAQDNATVHFESAMTQLAGMLTRAPGASEHTMDDFEVAREGIDSAMKLFVTKAYERGLDRNAYHTADAYRESDTYETLGKYLDVANPLSGVPSGKLGEILARTKKQKIPKFQPVEKMEEDTPLPDLSAPPPAPIVQLLPVLPSAREKLVAKIQAMNDHDILGRINKEMKAHPVLRNPLAMPEDWGPAFVEYVNDPTKTISALAPEKKQYFASFTESMIKRESLPIQLVDYIKSKTDPAKFIPREFYANPNIKEAYEYHEGIRQKTNEVKVAFESGGLSAEELTTKQQEINEMKTTGLAVFYQRHKENKKQFRLARLKKAEEPADKMDIPTQDETPVGMPPGPMVAPTPELQAGPEIAELPPSMPRITDVDSGPLGNVIRALGRVYSGPLGKLQEDIVEENRGIVPMELLSKSRFAPGSKSTNPWTDDFNVMKESQQVVAPSQGGAIRVAKAMRHAGFNIGETTDSGIIEETTKKYAAAEAFYRYFANKNDFGLLDYITGKERSSFTSMSFSEIASGENIGAMFGDVLMQTVRSQPDNPAEETPAQSDARKDALGDLWSQFYSLGIASELQKTLKDMKVFKDDVPFDTFADAMNLMPRFETLFGDNGLLLGNTGIETPKSFYASKLEADARSRLFRKFNSGAASTPELYKGLAHYASAELATTRPKYGIMGLETDLPLLLNTQPYLGEMLGTPTPLDTSTDDPLSEHFGVTMDKMMGYTRRMDQTLVLALMEGFWRAMEAVPAGNHERNPPNIHTIRDRGMYVNQFYEERERHIEKQFGSMPGAEQIIQEFKQQLDGVTLSIATSVYSAMDALAQVKSSDKPPNLPDAVAKIAPKAEDTWNHGTPELAHADAFSSILAAAQTLMERGMEATPRKLFDLRKANSYHEPDVFPSDITFSSSPGNYSWQPALHPPVPGIDTSLFPFVSQTIDTLYALQRGLAQDFGKSQSMFSKIFPGKSLLTITDEIKTNIDSSVLDTLRGASRRTIGEEQAIGLERLQRILEGKGMSLH